MDEDESKIAEKYEALHGVMDEKLRRLWAATEARALRSRREERPHEDHPQTRVEIGPVVGRNLFQRQLLLISPAVCLSRKCSKAGSARPDSNRGLISRPFKTA